MAAIKSQTLLVFVGAVCRNEEPVEGEPVKIPLAVLPESVDVRFVHPRCGDAVQTILNVAIKVSFT